MLHCSVLLGLYPLYRRKSYETGLFTVDKTRTAESQGRCIFLRDSIFPSGRRRSAVGSVAADLIHYPDAVPAECYSPSALRIGHEIPCVKHRAYFRDSILEVVRRYRRSHGSNLECIWNTIGQRKLYQ